MKEINLQKNKTEMDYFYFGEHKKMRIESLPSTILPITIQMKHIPSGLEMNFPIVISESITDLLVNEYNWIKINYHNSSKIQNIKFSFDEEVI